MSQIVLIPWRPQPSRLAAFDAVVAWYRENLGDVNIQTVDSNDEIFNLAQCRNLGISSVPDDNDVVIINDADTIPELESLRAALDAASTSGLVHLPYTRYHWLGAQGTSQYLSGRALADADHELVIGACSGVYVTTPATWWAHGGQDERFRGWGFEDAAWYLAHETLLGAPPVRHDGAVYALGHIPEVREGPQYDANAQHMQRYRDASGSVDRMTQLVESVASADRARVLPGS